MLPSPAPSDVWPVPNTFRDDTGGQTACIPAQRHGRLSGLADRVHLAPPRRNRTAAVMDVSRLNDEAPPFQRGAKGFVGHGLLGVNPDDEQPSGTQEIHQPVERDLEGFERAPPPIDQRHVVLAGRTAAICGGCRAGIAAALQFQHQLNTLRAGDDDPVLLRATRERDHRVNDPIACGSGMRGNHDITLLVQLMSGADAGIGRLAAGQASRASLARVSNVAWSLSRGLPTHLEYKVPAADHCLQ